MTDYNDISYDTESYTDTGHGRGIFVDEQGLYVDNIEYYVDGSVVFRDTMAYEPEIKCNNTVVLCNDRWTVNCAGREVYIKDTSDV